MFKVFVFSDDTGTTEIIHAATILGMVERQARPATLPERIVERLVPRSA